MVPRGTGAVGVGMIVNAAGAYGHLALSGRALDTAGMAGLAVVWAVAFSVGIGLFFPLEQELTRTVAARVAGGAGTGPLLRRGVAVAAGLLAGAVLLLMAAHRPLVRLAFDGDAGLLWPLAGALSALAAAHTLRGLLAGHARFTAYAGQLTLDGALRLGAAAALLLTGSHSPAAFALILTACPLLACLPFLPAARHACRATTAEPGRSARGDGIGVPPAPDDGRHAASRRWHAARKASRRRATVLAATTAHFRPEARSDPSLVPAAVPAASGPHDAATVPATAGPGGPATLPAAATAVPATAGPGGSGAVGGAAAVAPVGAGEIGRGLGALVAGAVFAQVLANAPVLGAKGLAPGDAALVTALLCALTLVRVPQFAVGALQAGLLRELTVRQQLGDRAGVARGVRRSAGGMAALGVVCTVPAALAGPWVTEHLLAAPPVLGRLDFAALGLGTTGYLVAFLLGNGTLATGGHRRQALAWAAGTAVTAAAVALPGPPGPRVEAAYALGSWTAAALLAARLIRTLRPETPAKGTPMSDTASPDYTARLLARRVLPTQAPYRWNLRRLRLGRVLDVGCGVGRNLRHCAPGSVGVDHNEHSVAAARARGLTAYTPEEFAATDCAPGSFDSLLCAHVLEHLDAAKASALLARYLPYVRPGGRAVLITPQEAGFASDATHVRFVGFAELTEEARAAGLDVRRAYSFPLPRAAGRLFRHNEFVLVSTAPRRQA
ncbi:class I SAM-dependent methyltransferase [Streptomyces sp. NBC_01198]|uniref:class I SAM-dependent methyltransferase n=1 Tax=Streptomyces sp. NBC_01198 TaxID=2903769 RepID=UPI002E0E1565|nr:class I SAM-dependent methyltransferase [Streptomyces sp. NBC_01198]